MKRMIYIGKCSIMTIAAFFYGSCNSETDVLNDTQDEWKPLFSRASAASATVAGFMNDGARVFQSNMAYDGSLWQWVDGVSPSKGSSQKVICTIPALEGTASTHFYYSPAQNSRLQWDCLDVAEQGDDGRFYFQNVSHRVAQMHIELDRYFTVDELKASLSTSGYFNCLTGMFDEVSNPTSRYIYPSSKTVDGKTIYVYTFTIIPQTFKAGTTLLTYKDVYSDGYYTYNYKLDRDITIDPNERLVVKAKWNTDWTGGSYTETKTNITVSVTAADWEVNQIINGSASENN